MLNPIICKTQWLSDLLVAQQPVDKDYERNKVIHPDVSVWCGHIFLDIIGIVCHVDLDALNLMSDTGSYCSSMTSSTY